MSVFRILQTITCGFEPGELRRYDEFPPGFEPARLVVNASIVPVDPIAIVPGMPVTETLLADIDDLNTALIEIQKAQDARMVEARNAFTAKDEELAAANATITSLSERLAQTETDAAAKIADLEAELLKVRTDLEAAVEAANKKKKAT